MYSASIDDSKLLEEVGCLLKLYCGKGVCVRANLDPQLSWPGQLAVAAAEGCFATALAHL